MCLLTYIPPGVQPNAEHLAAGASMNRDGCGFAIAQQGTLIVRKNMDADVLIAEFMQVREDYPDGPALFHSRMGTGGVRTVFNCHPFYMGKDLLTVVAHNGVLFGMKSDRRCDTRAFADTLLPEWFGKLDHFRLRLTLERWLGSMNKMVVITANPAFTHSAYILNEDSGIWDNDTGIWHSNSDYRSWRYRSYRAHADGGVGAFIGDAGYTLGDTGRGVKCMLCDRRGGVDPDTSHCIHCGYCNDCYEPQGCCQCYIGAEHRQLTAPASRLAITAGEAVREEVT